MKRDMDLIRQILLDFENGKKSWSCLTKSVADAICAEDEHVVPDDIAKAHDYHINLLVIGGFIEAERNSASVWYIERMTWHGHDFIDSVRDNDIWKETKNAAKSVGGWSVEILTSLAKGFIKTKLQSLTGMDL